MRVTSKPLPPFMVESLSLENYRGFSSLRVDDWGPINVLVGINGAGKSAVLSALAVGLSRFTAAVVGDKNTVRFELEDLKAGSRKGRIVVGLKEGDQRFSQAVSRRAPGMPLRVDRVEGRTFSDLASEYQEAIEEDDSDSLPIIVLYNVGRAVSEVSAEPSGRPEYRPISAYSGAFRSDRRFQAFFEWFRDREDLENQRKVRQEEAEDPQLEAVRHAIGRLMKGYSDLHIDRSPLRMLLRKGDQELNVNQLSDGEKTLLALVGDLARRLAIANPESEKPLSGKGIVMIDEVDLHLHPTWQRRVVKTLPKVFPKVQFFLTTHSAIVASSAPRGSLYVLEEGTIERREAFGQDVGLVLDELFDTEARDEEVQGSIDRLFEAIVRKEADQADVQLRELEALLGTNDPMLVRARTKMRGLGVG